MEDKKETKISLTALFLLMATIIIIIMAFFMYEIYRDKQNAIQNIEELNDKINSLEKNIKTLEIRVDNLYDEENAQYFKILETKLKNVKYRTDTGGSSGFAIDNGKVYSGSSADDHSKEEVKGIPEEAKYVVPIDKQDGKTAVLTVNGNLYTNVPITKAFSTDFKLALSDILAIVNIPEVEEQLFLTGSGYLVKLDGSVYLDLNME